MTMTNQQATIHQLPEPPDTDEILMDVAGMVAWMLDVSERIELEVHGLCHGMDEVHERLVSLEVGNAARAAENRAALETLARIEALVGSIR